jgi:hypothetical protein
LQDKAEELQASDTIAVETEVKAEWSVITDD